MQKLKVDHANILDGVRKMAALRQRPDYQAALSVLANEFPGFVPAVSGSEIIEVNCELTDLGMPGLFERRATYLKRQDVQALTAEGKQRSVVLERWELGKVGSTIPHGSWRIEMAARMRRAKR